MTNATIITIGDELLIGQVIDTNSAWIAQQLNTIGIRVIRRVAVGDVWDDIWNALDEESSKADLILITGGLGPTADDITKPLLCKYFDGKMIINQKALENVTMLFEKVFKRPITERNLKQAEVPDTCKVLINTRGTAPGMLFEKNGKIFISMPGVPGEMKGLMEDIVIPDLKNRYPEFYLAHRTLVTFGIGESMLADLIQDFESSLPKTMKLAYLPNYGIVRLRLSAQGNDKEQIDSAVDFQFMQLQLLVKDYLVIAKDVPMENAIAELLISHQKTISTAESCTGGYLSHLLTSIPGSSSFYKGSMITYSNESKENLLSVNHSTLTQRGAVSEEVVREMAKGLLQQLKTDYAIAVSGIMGPDGGTIEKPVGMVWIAVGNKSNIISKSFQFRFDRQKNIQVTAMNAFNLLRIFIINKHRESN